MHGSDHHDNRFPNVLHMTCKPLCRAEDHPNSGVYVKDLTAFVVKSVEEMNAVLANGLANRSVSSTNMNKESSRSHSIFTITVEQCALDAEGEGLACTAVSWESPSFVATKHPLIAKVTHFHFHIDGELTRPEAPHTLQGTQHPHTAMHEWQLEETEGMVRWRDVVRTEVVLFA